MNDILDLDKLCSKVHNQIKDDYFKYEVEDVMQALVSVLRAELSAKNTIVFDRLFSLEAPGKQVILHQAPEFDKYLKGSVL